MHLLTQLDDPRRRLLIQALSTGFLSALVPGGLAQAQSLFGDKPGKLPEGRSIYRLAGEVKVNGKPATQDTRIQPGDTVSTGKDGEIIFVVGSQAMILRSNSQVQIIPPETSVASTLIAALRILNGKLLSVSRNAPMRIETSTATIGIRGTGFYVESVPDQTYFCTCYGTTDINATADPESKTSVTATHHDRPLYIVQDGGRGNNIRNAPFINHTDQELALIEALVGRTTPFVFSNDSYRAPRRNY